jgi:MoaA/NifB/PqqE/SkfB family radical SAM enzyme
LTGALTSRTVQIHLNRLCNLSCLHCYSRSGPGEREKLSLGAVAAFMADARAEGYERVAFSGGEPFLHPDFREIVLEAHRLGLSPVAVTNGTVLDGRRAAALPHLDLVAVSVDGPEPVHNQLRGSGTAFARMAKGLETIRASGVPFGIAHTVTRDSLVHLPWVAGFAEAAGAGVLQLHPLGLVGAAEDHELAALDGETLARAYLCALALRVEHGERLSIHVDLFNRHRLREQPCQVVPPATAPAGTPLADLINPLVLRSDGRVAPICHGLADAFPVADLAAQRLAEGARRFIAERLPRLHHAARRMFEVATADADGWPWLNWYELLEHGCAAAAAPSPVPAAIAAAS